MESREMSLRGDLLAVAKDKHAERVQKYGYELYEKCIRYIREQAEYGFIGSSWIESLMNT